jgi:hypothetical protein
MRFPPEQCKSARDGWPPGRRYPPEHPCRDTADLASWSRYAEKVAALRAMFQRLDAQGVALIALQEVSGIAAVQQLLPPGWSAATTGELPGTPPIAQHVGIAWRRGIVVRDIEAINTVADSGVPSVRCGRDSRSPSTWRGNPSRTRRASEGGLPQPRPRCAVRRARMPRCPTSGRMRSLPIARCCAISCRARNLDRCARPRDFAVLGDFNRTLLREPLADSADVQDAARWQRGRRSARSLHDGAPGHPLDRAMHGAHARHVSRAQRRASARAVLWRARFADLGTGGAIRKGSSGDCSIAGAHGDLTHDGIDHVLISESLKRRLTPDALTLHAVNYQDVHGLQLHGARDLALPSDHCPHVVAWTGKRPR